MKQNLHRNKKVTTLTKCLGVLFMLAATTNLSFSQTLQERQQIMQKGNNASLDSLSARFKVRYESRELKVKDYLLKHPEVKRTFEKNGSFYFLQRIMEDGTPIYINTKSNLESGKMIGADQLYPNGNVGANVTGTNMIVGIWDGGQVRATHELLSGKVTMQPGQALDTLSGNNHMTHVSGTIVGKEITAKLFARGIAYGATSMNYDFSDDQTEMIDFAKKGYLISNHSYGNSNDNKTPLWLFGAYDTTAMEWDEIVKNAPGNVYLPFVAVGNEQTSSGNPNKAGYDLITGSSAAKNVMTIGALNKDSTMSDYSNWGPTDDGRFKPEIVARGTGINSSYSTADNAYSGEENSSGTSYSTPAASAAALLLQQYYHNITNSYMQSATLKSLLMHTAYDSANLGPNYRFGYGLLSADKAGLLIKKAKSLNSGASITEYATNPVNNGINEIAVTVVANGTEPLKVSIGWMDDAGPVQTVRNAVDTAGSRLVYNFDVMVKANATNVSTWPWRPMGMANRTARATRGTNWFENDNNNYRQVRIDNPVANATYTIYIRKSAASPQPARTFALIVSGTAALALPVKLVSITVASQGASNLVHWETATEDANTVFLLQRSENGIQFSDVTSLKGKGAASGYGVNDMQPFATATFYRLKITEGNGSVSYSKIVVVRRNNESKLTITPNPATTTINITNTKQGLNGTQAILTDIQGRELKRFIMQPYQQVNISQLKAGVYLLKTTDGSNKIVKQ